MPRQFFPGVEKGVRDVAEKGPIAGYPVIDFKATLYDGSFHTVDSDELSFRLAGAMATRKGIQEAEPVLLEPIMEVEVRVPEAYMGEVNRDLNTRRGRVLGMDADGGQQIVRALVPQAELFTYATELRSITGGRGHLQRQALARTRRCPRTWPRRSSRPTRPRPTRTTDGRPAGLAGAPRQGPRRVTRDGVFDRLPQRLVQLQAGRSRGVSPAAASASARLKATLVERTAEDGRRVAAAPPAQRCRRGCRRRRTR